MLDDFLKQCDNENIRKLLNSPKKLQLNGAGLHYESNSGDLLQCSSFGTCISNDNKWLSNKILSVPFDIDQDCNLKKGEEAKGAYCRNCDTRCFRWNI